MEIFSAFQSLPRAESKEEFTAHKLAIGPEDFLAKGLHGEPVFLLRDHRLGPFVIGRALKNLSVEHQVTCSVTSDGQSLVGVFSSIGCSPGRPELYEIFVRTVAASAAMLDTQRSTRHLAEYVGVLIDTFQNLGNPNNKEVMGLWAELWTISNCGDVCRAIDTWHVEPSERYDFSSSSYLLEVKSTILPRRQHTFSLEQLVPPPSGRLFIMSVMMQPLSGGLGVLALASQIESQLAGHPSHIAKLWLGIAKCLGADFCDELDKRFDQNYAARHSRIYAANDIPAVSVASSAITQVKFTVDLTSIGSSLPNDSVAFLNSLIREHY